MPTETENFVDFRVRGRRRRHRRILLLVLGFNLLLALMVFWPDFGGAA